MEKEWFMARHVLVALTLVAALATVPAFGAVIRYETNPDSQTGFDGVYAYGKIEMEAPAAGHDFSSMFSFTNDFGAVADTTSTNGSVKVDLTVSGNAEDGWSFAGLIMINDDSGEFVVGNFVSTAVYFTGRVVIVGTLTAAGGVLRSDASTFHGDESVFIENADAFSRVSWDVTLQLCTQGVEPDTFFARRWAPICNSWLLAEAVYVKPEPMTMSLLALGGLALLRRRSR